MQSSEIKPDGWANQALVSMIEARFKRVEADGAHLNEAVQDLSRKLDQHINGVEAVLCDVSAKVQSMMDHIKTYPSLREAATPLRDWFKNNLFWITVVAGLAFYFFDRTNNLDARIVKAAAGTVLQGVVN